MRRIRKPSSTASRVIRRPKPRDDFWHAHAHSNYSTKDALPSVKQMVDTAARHHQPALALTDHGNMSGSVQLYKHAKRRGITPFPGLEAYLKRDATNPDEKRYHVGLIAFTTEGYEALVKLSSKSHTRQRFHHKPQVDFTDFAEWSQRGWTDGIALTTGCFFGMVQQAIEDHGDESASWIIKTMAQWFPHLYVELQHHNIQHDNYDDDEMVSRLTAIADHLGLPTVITQDSHYCDPEEKPYHETLKRLVAYGDGIDDAVFPGDSFHLAHSQWVKSHYPEIIWRKGIDGLKDLYSKHSLVVPELEQYHYNVPAVTFGDPEVQLRDACKGWVKGKSPRYRDRLEEELEVVEFTRMASYLLLVQEVTDWCNANGVFFQTRGSASGSLICYILGITQYDPLKWNLRYERFLSKDRTKPPDIDLDVEDTRRDDLIDWLRSKFNVCQIGTYSTFSLNADGPQAGRGSLLVSYVSKMRRLGQDVSHIQTAYDLDVNTREQLAALADRGVKRSPGTHAAGLVITSTREEFERIVPTMLIPSSETTVTQFEMDDVEDLGFVKLDVLGLKTLSLMRKTIELIGLSVHDPLDWIPLNDRETFKNLRRGNTDGVFQLEGYAAQKGCKEMKVKSVKDIVNLLALYRPATMSTGVKDSFINRMAGWESVPERHEHLTNNLKETYGLPVFQEQVVSILRDLGFTPDELTDFLKAVKASNKNIGNAGQVIERYHAKFLQQAEYHQWSQSDVQFAWQAIEGFSEYGFGRSHATGYGVTAYRMAYLKTHYPLEFATALLQVWAGTQKEKQYVLAVKEMGIRLMPPDVNVSGFSWSIDRKNDGIRKGLLSIKGVGERAAKEIAENAPYESLDNLISSCDARAVTGGKSWKKDGSLNGVLGKLAAAGALKSLGVRASA